MSIKTNPLPLVDMNSKSASGSSNREESTITSDQLSFGFANLCGSPFSGGSVVFSRDGNCLFSPVSNRVLVTDLASNRSWTVDTELRSSTALIIPMPSTESFQDKYGRLVLAIDVEGYGLLFESSSGTVLNRINFKGRVNSAIFSQDGKWLATAVGRRIKVWRAATVDSNWQFVLFRQFAGHIGDVTSLEFAPPSSKPNEPDFLLSAGADSIVRIWSLNFEESPHFILNELSQSIAGAFFFEGRNAVVAVNRSGSIVHWKREQHSNTYEVQGRAQIQAGVGYVTCVAFDSFSGLLCLGLSGGAFTLYTVPQLESVQSFSVGASVSSVSISSGGDWVAVGVQDVGQLIVWEWKAENFIFRQQGHHDGVNCVAFCPVGGMASNRFSSDLLDVFGSANGGMSATFNAGGGLIATGGVEGKVKLWHSVSGFCFVTLTDHTSSIEAVAFTPQGNAVISASTDGSVRAYELLKYKNFRTLTPPTERVQFGSLAIDSSGDIVAAGACNGSYNVYVWSLQTGQCLEVLPGHEARISHLRFAPSSNDGILASCSWDSSLKVWDVFARKNKAGESLMNQREVSCCAFDPVDGTIVAVASLAGHITFWDTRNGIEVGSIDAIRDIGSGRKEGQKFSTGALKGKRSKRDGSGTEVNLNQYFSAMEYGGAAGRWLVAVSRNSAFACIFDPLEKNLIKRIELTTHAGLSGVKQFLNSRFHSDLVDDDGYEDLDRSEKRAKRVSSGMALPGVSRGDMRLASGKRVWRVNGLAVSPDGQEIAVGTSEGAYILSMNSRNGKLGSFNPTDISEEVSTKTVEKALTDGDYRKAAICALSLSDLSSFETVFYVVGAREQIAQVVQSLPRSLFVPLVRNISKLLHPVEGTKHVERAMLWISLLVQLKFNEVQFAVHQTRAGSEIRAALCSILQHVQTHSAALGSLMRDNSFVLSFLTTTSSHEDDEDATTADDAIRFEDVVA
jgi:periodic tryptophan protein 2